MTMKILVTGVSGQLGYDAANEAITRGHEVIGTDVQMIYSGAADGSPVTDAPYVMIDITDRESVFAVMEEIRPDAVIHCAGWTAVDAAEDEENRAKVRAVNVDGTRHLAEAAKNVECNMMYISTDYVFDGKGEKAWMPDDKTYAPLNVYGQSKLDGELAVSEFLEKFFIVRTSWLFGKNGNNFIKTMIGIGKMHDQVRVICDQVGTPTYSADLARLLIDMIETEKYGYYHATNEGDFISWYDLCVEAYKQYGLAAEVIPVTTAEYGASKALRPLNSRLDKSKLSACGFAPLPDWKDAVKRYLAEANI